MLRLDTAMGSWFSIGMLFAFIAYKTQFVQRISALIEKGLELRMLSLHTERVGDVALQPIEQVNELRPVSAVPLTGQIEVKHLAFRHTETDLFVLQDVQFRIQAGESVAIVGASGCGKTTLIKLMLGLLQPTDGQIEIDSVPLDRMGIARYRQAVASVMQDDQLFAGSIAENICFFDAHPDYERIITSARLAAIHDDIMAMPMQFNTLVGDMGAVLSGGQIQRVLLARSAPELVSRSLTFSAREHLTLSRAVFEKISYRENPDGWMGIFPIPQTSLDDLKLSKTPLIIVAESIEKPGNLGAILRTADAAGVDALLVCDARVDVWNPNVVRASRGAVFSVPVVACENAEALKWLKGGMTRIVAATPSADEVYSNVDLSQPVAIGVGTEDEGLSDFWMTNADVKVKIPMMGKVNSLNVSVSTALILYEAVRQRG